MCGLLYTKRLDNRSVVKSLLKRYEHQKTRGTQGFGYAVVRGGVLSDLKRAKYEYYIKEFLNAENDVSEIMFHHRMPTSTENLEEVTHPIVVENDSLDYNYFVIHNGILQNEDELKTLYESLGFKYTTDITKRTTIEVGGKITKEETTVGYNDSESFAIDLARFLDGDTKELISVGSIAFICYQTYKDGRIKAVHYGRNDGNPLIIEDNNDLFVIKSSGSGKNVEADKIFTIDYATWETTSRDVSVGKTHQQKMGFHQNRTLVLPERSKTEENVPVVNYEKDSNDGIVSFYASGERRETVLEEIAQYTADIQYARDSLKDYPKLDHNERVFYMESVKQDTKTLGDLEEELAFLDDLLGYIE